MSDATTTLLTSTEETQDGMFVRLSSGGPHTRAILSAVRDRYNAITGRPRPTEEDLLEQFGQKSGQKVTLVIGGENMLGSGMIVAREGTIFRGSSGNLCQLPKRARRNGYVIDFANLLDAIPGYSTAKAQELVNEVRSHFPTLRQLTPERLRELPSEDEQTDDDPLSLCCFGTHRLPDSKQSDAIYLASAYWPEDDIVDRGILLVRPEHGFSEHGSIWGQQLLRDMGEVVGFEPISFKEGIDLCDLDFDEAYARVIKPALAGVA